MTTVAKLIEILKQLPQDMLVVQAGDEFHDYYSVDGAKVEEIRYPLWKGYEIYRNQKKTRVVITGGLYTYGNYGNPNGS